MRLLRWLVLPALFLALALSRHAWLTVLGSYLVSAAPPQPAEVALVLAGDSSGNRILKAAELVRQGYVPKVLVSGPEGMYGFYECDLAIPFAVRAGYPESYFVRLPHRAKSTSEEAAATIPELRRAGARRVDLVTSDYHTRRAARIYRAAAPDLQFIVIAAPDAFFRPDGWWLHREGRKTFAIEWLKTVTEWVGM